MLRTDPSSCGTLGIMAVHTRCVRHHRAGGFGTSALLAVALLAALGALVVAPPAASQGSAATGTTLVVLDGAGGVAEPYAADGGSVVGALVDPGTGTTQAARWDAATGAVEALGTIGGTQGRLVDVGPDGTAVGTSSHADGTRRAVRVAPGSAALEDLGTLAGTASSEGRGVDAAGRVVGVSCDACGLQPGSFDARPWVWTPTGGLQPLDLGGGAFGDIRDVSPQGLATGPVVFPDATAQAATWDLATGSIVLHGSLAGRSLPTAIAADGAVVGDDRGRRPFLVPPGGAMTELATTDLPAGTAADVTDELVVGVGDLAATATQVPVAWVRGPDGATAARLPTLAGDGGTAWLANGAGLVVGTEDRGHGLAWRRTASGTWTVTGIPPLASSGVTFRDLTEDGLAVGTYGLGVDAVGFAMVVATVPDPPAAVAGFLGPFGAELTWSPPLDDGGSPLTAYEIWRDGALAATVGPDEDAWIDPEVRTAADGQHRYEVRAVNALGPSPPSVAVVIGEPRGATPVSADPTFTG